MRTRLFASILALFCLASCEVTPIEVKPSEKDNKYTAADGVAYLYDGTVLPEMHIDISESEWNRLLKAFDRDSNTKEQVVCKVTYDKAGEISVIDSATVRLKGNTSRRRP